ncbi:hypothetical protein Hanom_Chr15g01406461 [Helianthus anomalus]
MYSIKSLLYNAQKHRNTPMYKKRAPQLRLRSIFTLKSAPQLRFLYIVRLMSHKQGRPKGKPNEAWALGHQNYRASTI